MCLDVCFRFVFVFRRVFVLVSAYPSGLPGENRAVFFNLDSGFNRGPRLAYTCVYFLA